MSELTHPTDKEKRNNLDGRSPLLCGLLEEDSGLRFVTESLGRIPYARSGTARGFVDCLDTQRFAVMLKAGISRLRVIKDRRLATDQSPANGEDLEGLLADGYSLVVRYCQYSHPQLGELADAFEKYFFSPVDLQAVCTPAGPTVFERSVDLEETFIVQVSGRQRFELRRDFGRPPALSKLGAPVRCARDGAKWKLLCEIQAGDWLYVPSGWSCTGEALTRSTHVTLAMRTPRPANREVVYPRVPRSALGNLRYEAYGAFIASRGAQLPRH